MNTKHLKARILDLALQGKLVENSRISSDLNSRIPSDFNPPFEIPNSWAWVNISDICNSITAGGDKPKNISNTKTQDFQIPIYTNAVANQGLYGYTDKPTITNEAITISARGTIGYAAIRTEPFYPIVRLIVLSLNSNLTLTKFIYFAILSLGIKSEGTSTPQLTIPSLKKQLFIPLPPLDEQERIVKKIDELFSQIDILETSKQNLLKNIRHTKARILDLALQGKLVENSRIPNDLNSRIPSDFNPPFEIPNSWAWVKISEIIQEQPKSKIQVKEASLNKKYLFFTSGNKIYTCSEFLVKGQNIFLNTGGMAGVKFYDGECAYSTDTYTLTSSQKSITKFLFYLILSNIKYINDFYFRGVGLKHLNKKEFKEMYIPLPPLDEQERIVKKIDELFEILEVIENSL